MNSRITYPAFLLLTLSIAACSSTGPNPGSTQGAESTYRSVEQRAMPYGERQQAKQRVVAIAKSMLGVPYTFGGESPETGFDCSGLVQYAHEQVGVDIPRTTGGQYKAVMTIPRRALQAGDLVFFKTRYDRFITHVGIYLGNGRFIHAPSSGKSVSIADMRDRYWSRRFTAAGRLF